MDFFRPGEKRFFEKYEPLLDEFWQMGSTISIDESLEKPFEESHKKSRRALDTGNPLCFKDIQQNFENAIYTDLNQIVNDMRKITREVRKSHTGLNTFANEVDLYIERTIVPVLHADGISKLYGIRTRSGDKIQIKLDANNGMTEKQRKIFNNNFTDVDRLKMFLRLPLPAITSEPDEGIIPTANLSKAGTTSKSEEKRVSPNLSTIGKETGELNAASMPKKSSFKVGGSKFKVGVTSFDALPKFNILITETNQINRDIFAKTYVERFLQNAKLDEVIDVPLFIAQGTGSASNEFGVKTMLAKSLYSVIRPLVLNSLIDTKEHFQKRLEKIIEQRPYLKLAKSNGKVVLNSEFERNRIGANFFGIRLIADLEIGYFSFFEQSEKSGWTLPAFYTTLGEVKYVTFDLGTCINDLKGSDQWNIEPETNEENARRLRIKEVEDTLYKYTSASVRFGVTRYVLSDYRGFLLVKLSYKKEQPIAGYGTSLSPPPEYDQPQYIKSEYTYFANDEPYIRLYMASFLSLDNEFIEEMKQFRKLIFKEWEEVLDSTKREQAEEIRKEKSSGGHADQGNRPPGLEGGAPDQFRLSSTSSFGTVKTTGPLTLSESSSGTSTGVYNDISASKEISKDAQFNESVHYDEDFFKRPSYIEIGSIIQQLIATGQRISQVIMINLGQFGKLIPDNLLKRDRLPQNCVLKVYDPYLGQLVTWDSSQFEYARTTYSYQTAMDYCSREARAYCELSEYWGDFLPKLYGYGRLSDLSPCMDDILYLHFCGGYIMLEYLEKARIFVITEDFFKRILRLYNLLHSKNIIQNDIKDDNAIITTSGEFKIIDFSHCRFDATDLEKKEEIDLVYQHFGRPEWR